MALEIIQYPALKDNYNFLLRDEATGQVAVVDPSEAEPAVRLLEAKGWRLDFILNTHHHADHIGGNAELKARYGCPIAAYAGDRQRIPGIDIPLQEGDRFSLGESVAEIWYIPGHTLGHIAYYFAGSKALFSGDTLFSSGCGRLFEGTAEQMWVNMRRIRDLPDDVMIYCAHEYTQANLAFALHYFPDDPAIADRAADVSELRGAGKPTVPTSVGLEKRVNPFLRADEPAMAALLGFPGDGQAVFTRLRRLKDAF